MQASTITLNHILVRDLDVFKIDVAASPVFISHLEIRIAHSAAFSVSFQGEAQSRQW
jgi:hypothetical protein